MKDQIVSMVGLGKLGAPLGACLASKGFQVIGVDSNQDVVRLINEGKSPVFEPGLDELIHANRNRIRATLNFNEAIAQSQITFVIVPTPSDKDGGFSLEYVLAAAEKIGDALRTKDGFHIVILTSTVLPGSTENKVLPVLESRSGKKVRKDFGLCYNPEFIALGSVIRDVLNPDFILIGESDERTGGAVATFYGKVCDNQPPIMRMNWVNAELTKLAVNTYVTTKISYANMLTEICEKLPGADVGMVTKALGLDSRIGGKYLKGALGYGGPCFPRDNVAFSYMTRLLGTQATLAEATDEINRRQVKRLEEKILSAWKGEGKVGILGLAYKPDTNVVERSQGLELAASLAKQGVPLALYDPHAMENAQKILGDKAIFASSMADCARQVSVLVITTPSPEFKNLEPHDVKSKTTIIDCWRILNPEKFRPNVNYIALGIGERK